MHPDRLRHEASHFRKNGTRLIGGEQGLRSLYPLRHQSGVDGLAQLALHRPERNPRHAGKLPQITGFADMAVQHGQHRAACAAEQGVRKCSSCTHYGVNRTKGTEGNPKLYIANSGRERRMKGAAYPASNWIR